MTPRTTHLVVAMVSVFAIVIHLVFYNTLEFHRDELLYFSLGSHPAAGYASVPPMIGLLAWVMIRLIGYSLLAAKILPAIGAGILVVLTDAIVREMKGGSFARILVGITVTLMPLSLRIFFFFMPVFLELLEWTLILYLVVRYVNTKNNTLIILLGAVAGVALLTKYLVALLILALLVVVPFTKHRKLFREKSLYIASGVAILIFSPNLVWQFVKGFPVILHMKELAGSQLVNVDRVNFFTDLLMFSGTGFLLFIPGFLYLLVTKKLKSFRLFAWVSIVVILVLLLLRGKSYYAAGIIPFLAAAGGIFTENILKSKLAKTLMILIIVLPDLLLLPGGIPVCGPQCLAKYFKTVTEVTGIPVGLRDEDGRIHALPHDYADMIGWNELTGVAAKAYRSVPDTAAAVIFAGNYGQAGAVNVIGKKYRLPQPLCFAESFMYWNPEAFPEEIKAVVYINEEPPGRDVHELFADVKPMGKISNPLAREYGTTVYLCTKPRKSFNEVWKGIVKERRNPFR